MGKLTPHLWRLYEMIKLNTEFGISLTVENIVDQFPEAYGTLVKTKGNYSNCPQLYNDIDLLNDSHEIDKIIIKNNNNFKIATHEEASDYYHKLYSAGIKKLVKAQAVMFKIRRDKQGKLLSNQNKEINPKVAREFFESFYSN